MAVRASKSGGFAPTRNEAIALVVFLGWCAYAKASRDERARESRGGRGRRGASSTSASTPVREEETRVKESAPVVAKEKKKSSRKAKDDAKQQSGFNPMMRVEVAEVHDERIDAKLAAEKRIAEEKAQLQAERERMEEDAAKAKEAAKAAAERRRRRTRPSRPCRRRRRCFENPWLSDG